MNKLLSVSWDVSLPCDYRCVYCRNDWGDTNNYIYPNGTDAIAATLQELAARGVTRIIYTGGEFFTFPHWRKTLELTKASGLEAWIVTNGYNIAESDLDFIEDHCTRLNFSFHAHTATLYNALMVPPAKDAFSKVLNTIAASSKRGIDVAIFFSPLRDNFSHFFKTIKKIQDTGAKLHHVNLNRIVPDGEANTFFSQHPPLSRWEHAALVRQGVKIHDELGLDVTLEGYPHCFLEHVIGEESTDKFIAPCFFGRKALALSQDGIVKLCPATSRDIGIHISEQDKVASYLNEFTQKRLGLVECSDCPQLAKCSSGCHMCGSLNADKCDPLYWDYDKIELAKDMDKKFFDKLVDIHTPFLSRSFYTDSFIYSVMLAGSPSPIGLVAMKKKTRFLEVAFLPKYQGKGLAFPVLQQFMLLHPLPRYNWTANKANYPSLKLLHDMGGGIQVKTVKNTRRIEAEGFFYPTGEVSNTTRQALRSILPESKKQFASL